jgi:hypothetical protein
MKAGPSDRTSLIQHLKANYDLVTSHRNARDNEEVGEGPVAGGAPTVLLEPVEDVGMVVVEPVEDVGVAIVNDNATVLP